MPRRGLSVDEPVQLGTVYMTAARGGAAAGSAGGRPLNGTFENADRYDRNPGTMRIAPTGRAATIFRNVEKAGAGHHFELIFSRYAPEVFDALVDLFADGAPFTTRIPQFDGRAWAGKCKPDRTSDTPLSAPGDHPHHAGQGRELTVRLYSTEGGWE